VYLQNSGLCAIIKKWTGRKNMFQVVRSEEASEQSFPVSRGEATLGKASTIAEELQRKSSQGVNYTVLNESGEVVYDAG
jgi:hypothetical protein